MPSTTRYVETDESGWLRVLNDKSKDEYLCAYTQMGLQSEAGGRTSFKVLDGPQSGKVLSLKNENVERYLGEQGPVTTGARLVVTYGARKMLYSAPKGATLDQQTARMTFSTQFANVTLNSIWDSGFHPLPAGKYYILIPDVPHDKPPPLQQVCRHAGGARSMSELVRRLAEGPLRAMCMALLALASTTCSRSEPDAPCVEGLNTTENNARCQVQAYLRYAADRRNFRQRKSSAESLYRSGLVLFHAGKYRKAYIDFSTSVVWVPSYMALVRAGDALFYMHAYTEKRDDGERRLEACSEYFLQEVELNLPQTYEVALLFLDFERKQTGRPPAPPQEVEGVRRRSACLRELRDRAVARAERCVPGEAIRKCLEGEGP